MLGISYSASVISNGTRWPQDAVGFVRRNKIRQVQISFDGLKMNHDKRRRFRKGYKRADEESSFDLAVDLVDRLLAAVRVDVRFNVDRGNSRDLEGVHRTMHCTRLVRKALSPASSSSHAFPTTPSAPASCGTRRSARMEFELVRERARAIVPAEEHLDETTSRSIYPLPRSSVCAALATDSVVIGANGHHYRCGLQVGEKNRAVLEPGPVHLPRKARISIGGIFRPDPPTQLRSLLVSSRLLGRLPEETPGRRQGLAP